MSLESDFKQVVEEYSELIDAKLEQARKLMNEAIAIAEEHGIPFYSSISPLGQEYRPSSYDTKWSELDPEVLEELGIYIAEYEGWQHSAVC